MAGTKPGLTSNAAKAVMPPSGFFMATAYITTNTAQANVPCMTATDITAIQSEGDGAGVQVNNATNDVTNRDNAAVAVQNAAMLHARKLA